MPIWSTWSEGDILTQSYQIAIRDGNGPASTQEVVITINGSNDAPVLVNDTPITDELRVNSAREDVQYFPSVSHLPDGGWVSVWMYYKPADGSSDWSTHVEGRVFNADGSPRHDGFEVFPAQEGFQYHQADVTSLNGGGWFVSWIGKGGGNDPRTIYGRLYEPDGTAGEIISISDENLGIDVNPAITALDDGGWVVSWVTLMGQGRSSGKSL